MKSTSNQSICKFCFAERQDPRVLPCGHIFCMSCIASIKEMAHLHMKNISNLQLLCNENLQIGKIACPLCYYYFDASSTFPSVMQMQQGEDDTMREMVSILCANECGSAAKVNCEQCKVPLCQLCFQQHLVFAMFRMHKALPLAVANTCAEHDETGCYCEMCQCLLCSKCEMHKHIDHSVYDAKQYANKCAMELSSTINVLKSQQELVQRAKLVLLEDAELVKQLFATAQEQVKVSFESMHTILMSKQLEVQQELQNICNRKCTVKLGIYLSLVQLLQAQTLGQDTMISRIDQITSKFDQCLQQADLAPLIQSKHNAMTALNNFDMTSVNLEPCCTALLNYEIVSLKEAKSSLENIKFVLTGGS